MDTIDGEARSLGVLLRELGVVVDLDWGGQRAALTQETVKIQRGGLIRFGVLILVAAVLWLAPVSLAFKAVLSLVPLAAGIYNYPFTRERLKPLRWRAARLEKSLGGKPAAVIKFTFGGVLKNRVLLAIKVAHDPAKSQWYNDWFWWLVPEEGLERSLARFGWQGAVVVFLAERFFETAAGFSAQSTREVVAGAAAALGGPLVPLPNAAFGKVRQGEAERHAPGSLRG